jgi:hypothetical protein
MDSMYAADGMTNMSDKGAFTPITMPENQHITNDKSGTGDARMGSKVMMEGKMNR